MDKDILVYFQFSKIKLTFQIFLAVIFVVIGLWLYLESGTKFSFTPFFARTIAVFAIIIFGILGFLAGQKIASRKPGFVITREGFIDHTYKMGLIKWTDIKEFKSNWLIGTKFLLVFVENPEEYLKNASITYQIFLKLYKWIYGTPISVSAGSLTCSYEDLHETLIKHYEIYSKGL